ncbi:hypothetical protein SANTM175S_04657 [Streptomyces antimycoticus]
MLRRYVCSDGVSRSAQGQSVDHRVRDGRGPALLDTGVVVDADPGKLGDLLTAQPPHPAPHDPLRQPEFGRVERGAARLEKRLDLRFAMAHPSIIRAARFWAGQVVLADPG